MKPEERTYKEIRTRLGELSQQQLIELMEELCSLNEDVLLFLRARLLNSSVSIESYRKKICSAFRVDPMYNEELEWHAADRAVEQYRMAADDEEGLAELLVLYVKEANDYTLEYGDIDEAYYEVMEESFQKAVDQLLSMREKQKNIDRFVEALRGVVRSTSGIGWGYHDALSEMFCEAFGDCDE